MAYSNLLRIEMKIMVRVDSEDLWDSLTTCHDPTNTSIKPHFRAIHHEFLANNVSWITWIPEKLNSANCLTKDSLINKTLQLMLFSSEMLMELPNGMIRSSGVSTG